MYSDEFLLISMKSYTIMIDITQWSVKGDLRIMHVFHPGNYSCRIWYAYPHGDLIWSDITRFLAALKTVFIDLLCFTNKQYKEVSTSQNWWRLFQKCVVRTKLDIYVFLTITWFMPLLFSTQCIGTHGLLDIFIIEI